MLVLPYMEMFFHLLFSIKEYWSNGTSGKLAFDQQIYICRLGSNMCITSKVEKGKLWKLLCHTRHAPFHFEAICYYYYYSICYYYYYYCWCNCYYSNCCLRRYWQVLVKLVNNGCRELQSLRLFATIEIQTHTIGIVYTHVDSNFIQNWSTSLQSN